jgi:transcriptional regulator with XRE-family HTH domain
MKHRRQKTTPFAKILTRLLAEKEVGIREAARMAGVGPSTIMSWKSGATPEDYVAVKRLANALGTTLCFMLTGEHESSHGGIAIAEVFEDGGNLFDGYAKVTIQNLIPRSKVSK